MEAVAKTKYLKGSPRKARLVIDQIRGADVSRALAILKFTEKRAAGPISKCLSSAIANATFKAEQANIAIDPDDLWIRKCFVDMGPHKNRSRMRPAPQGRAYREQRHYCHITIEVTSEEKPKTEKELLAEAAKARRAADPKEKKKAAKVATVEAANEEVLAAEVVAEEVAAAEAPAVENETETVAAAETEVAVEETVEATADETPEETVEAAADDSADETADDAVDTSDAPAEDAEEGAGDKAEK
jgi:large subunit ribosomal protein L22